MNFILLTQIIKDNAIRQVMELPVDESHPLQVSISEYKANKTVAQRNWMHTLCGLLGKEIGLTKGQVKELAKGELFGLTRVKRFGMDIVIADGSSEKIKRAEYSELIEIIYRMGAESGVALPNPTEFA